MKVALQEFESFYIENHGSNVERFQAKRSVQNVEDGQKAVATVKVTPTFVCNSVTVNEIVTSPASNLKASSDSEMPGTSTGTCDVGCEEKVTKKVTRNTSNGSKRKVRLRRMGSRQSSKTESDTEDEQGVNSDVARKVKRKTSKAKKQLESDKSFDSFQGEDEVAYVFKIKPGEKNEVTVKQPEIGKLDEFILISPTENSVEIVDQPTEDNSLKIFINAIVKTKRKLFTPVDVEGGTVNTTISQEIESSSASDKNENDKQVTLSPDVVNHVVVSTLPPLPSPKVQKKFELTKQNSGKDLSPSIRLMIDRYTLNMDKKSNSPNSSGSCSPIWRSPILDRRVRKQSEEYQHKIIKSNSSQEIGEKENDGVITIEGQPSIEIHDVKQESSTETLIDDKIVTGNKGAIPKEPKTASAILPIVEPQIAVESVTLRCDSSNKPRTPLSERAMKIKMAKEAFLKMPLISHDSSQSDWSYRLSQISVGSTDSNTDTGSLMKCLSAGVLMTEVDDKTSTDNKSSSLPRSTKGFGNDSETTSETSKSSRFGLSSLATKLRKVKLKRNTKEVPKMNTVPVLCRQSLAVDFTSANSKNNNGSASADKAGSSQNASRFRKNKHENIKKSKSLGILDK